MHDSELLEPLYEIGLTEKDFQDIEVISNCIDSIVVILQSNGSNFNFNGIKVITPYEVLLEVYGKDKLTKMDSDDINLFKVAEFYGINIIKKDKIKDNLNGFVSFSAGKINVEYVEQENDDLTKIIIAHELGHVFCHFTQGYKFIFADSVINNSLVHDNASKSINNTYERSVFLQASYNEKSDKYEKEAQSFAIDLIYPESAITINKTKEFRKLKTRFTLNNIESFFKNHE